MKASVKKNYILNVSYEVFAILAPIITTPYISRVLGAGGVGIYNYVYSIVNVFTLICALGTRSYAQREIAKASDDKEQRSRIFVEIMVIKLTCFAVLLPIYIVLAALMDGYTVYLYAAILYFIAELTDISWFYKGLEDFKKIVIRNLIVKIVGIILTFLIVKTSDDVNLYIILMGGSTLLGQLTMWMYVPKLVFAVRPSLKGIVRHLKPTITLFLPSVAIYVYTALDKIMLGSLVNEVEVGYYSQSEKIIKLVMTVITSLGTVLMPRVAKCIKNEQWERVQYYYNKSIRFVCCLSFPMMFGIIAVSEVFVPIFFGTGYEKCVPLMIALSPLLFIIGLSNVTGQSILVSMGKDKMYTGAVISGSLLNVVANFALIPYFASYGAVIATLLAESTVTIIELVGAKFLLKPKKLIHDNWKYVISSLVMFLILILIDRIISLPDLYMLVLLIVVGVCVYGISLLALRDDIVFEVLGMLRAKLKRN